MREQPAWTKAPGRWQDDLYDLLRRHNVTQFAYVPDAGDRRDAVPALIGRHEDFLIVSGLAGTSRDVAA